MMSWLRRKLFGEASEIERKMMELGLTPNVDGFQSTLGFFNRRTTRTKTATGILELLSAALAEERINIDFMQLKMSADGLEVEVDPFHLQMSMGEWLVTISVRIDQENHYRECNGFIPEECNGGFGVMLVVGDIEHRGDLYCREVFNSSHLADPSCNLEIAVAEIKRIVKGLQ
jgi:hypothetical protein